MNLEEFVDIIGYEGFYKINKNGDVFGVKRNKILKLYLNNYGYYCVNLSKNNIKNKCDIHRLIAIHFISNNDDMKNKVDHIDGITTNNNIENLRWTTNKENTRNKISKQNCICQFIRKETGTITYLATYPIYIDGKYIRKTKSSIHRNIVEEFVEQMKKDYPNQYTYGRVD